ncbi:MULTISPECIES: hypothetical protein [Desulfococcus]|uniref:Phasin n=1 Tax=Desulfococcus multivorans DSM 2059 TaxID=1121405 RepID=S7U689_DESML|nr:hypothetical protein [Desulfococcus multivorans]AOY57340.1 conserved uncharacterized protein [Desulfococcus multivorans]AQU99787.1 hypothetical protein B2D07_02690 [Desulfococcus multivorans]EPR45046.1 hypothetical protein dsmv_3714 [Desulfococcus multivorans DSM 2059]MDX9817483.1 hypothetical protein [Desulfococcus multivorans]SKA22315.1 hypothetical protein SAMN02745446_03361 [Desulfococcus multivorans DSM 2059]
MDTLIPVKQMLTFQKSLFDNTYEAVCRIQNQTEKMNDMFLRQIPFLSEDGRKMIDDSVTMGKTARDQFKKAFDEGFVKLEALYNIK